MALAAVDGARTTSRPAAAACPSDVTDLRSWAQRASLHGGVSNLVWLAINS